MTSWWLDLGCASRVGSEAEGLRREAAEGFAPLGKMWSLFLDLPD